MCWRYIWVHTYLMRGYTQPYQIVEALLAGDGGVCARRSVLREEEDAIRSLRHPLLVFGVRLSESAGLKVSPPDSPRRRNLVYLAPSKRKIGGVNVRYFGFF
jgi:hypothetical protein